MDTLQSEHGTGLLGRRVLMLGRDPDTNGATQKYLEFFGHEVTPARDSDSALSQAARVKPHVVICDLDLRSGQSRVDAARKIQEVYDAALVVVSSYPPMQVTHRFPDLEVAGCLKKPISLRQLARTVSEA